MAAPTGRSHRSSTRSSRRSPGRSSTGSRPRSTRERLVGYTRVSSEEQAKFGVSLDAQAQRISAYTIAHEVELVGIETDEGISGRIPPARRPGLAQALDVIRRGDADGLVVLRLDRLSRSTRDVLDLVDECGRDDWRLVSVNEHLDTGTAAGRLVVTVLAALSQMEREQVAERTQFALDTIARKGLARSRYTPFGFTLLDGSKNLREEFRGQRRLVPDPQEQRILARISHLQESGFGARRIARDLNERGDVNPRTGRSWSPALIQKVVATKDRLAALAV
jgi:site-specific DNA recombinase